MYYFVLSIFYALNQSLKIHLFEQGAQSITYYLPAGIWYNYYNVSIIFFSHLDQTGPNF